MILIADSGSTKTDWCAAEHGRIVGRMATQGINPFHQDSDSISKVIYEELLPQTAGMAPTAVYFYGSGCRDDKVPMMAGMLGRAFPTATAVECHGDLLGAARAVCGSGEGVAAILGTGANSCLYDGSGIVMNTPPLGYILGDEGSGAVLGRRFVNALFKGLLPKEVADGFVAETGLTVANVIERVYRQPLANRFLASLSPSIMRRTGCPEVRSIVVDNFRDFFSRNVAAYSRRDLPVGFVGGIAFHYAPLLAEAAKAEGFSIGRIMKSPMEGLVGFHG